MGAPSGDVTGDLGFHSADRFSDEDAQGAIPLALPGAANSRQAVTAGRADTATSLFANRDMVSNHWVGTKVDKL